MNAQLHTIAYIKPQKTLSKCAPLNSVLVITVGGTAVRFWHWLYELLQN